MVGKDENKNILDRTDNLCFDGINALDEHEVSEINIDDSVLSLFSEDIQIDIKTVPTEPPLSSPYGQMCDHDKTVPPELPLPSPYGHVQMCNHDETVSEAESLNLEEMDPDVLYELFSDDNIDIMS